MSSESRERDDFRVVALIATYNEQVFIRTCIESLISGGVEVYLIDNASTDSTLEIAEEYLGRGVIGIEVFERDEGVYRWEEILGRKEELATKLGADWYIHADADEVFQSPRGDRPLVEALREVEAAGYNAVDFQEYVFVPTREHPAHEPGSYERTMKWYYPFSPKSTPRMMRAWKAQDGPVGLSRSGGHKLDFPGIRLSPEKFTQKHYIFLSVPHLASKYERRVFDEKELDRGWHGWRARLRPNRVSLPSEDELKEYSLGSALDPSNPRKEHVMEGWSIEEPLRDLFFQSKTADAVAGNGVREEVWKNREGIEEYDVRWRWHREPKDTSMSAVVRVKNEALCLPHTLPPLLRSVGKVILIDNGSEDETVALAHSIAASEGLEDRLDVYEYPFEVSRCGSEHLGTYPDSVHSLTHYYNWSFSKVSSAYSLKWDGDMVLTEEGERVMRDLAWQTEGVQVMITIPRFGAYVENSSVAYVDFGVPNCEPWGWPNAPDFTFSKAFDWELRVLDSRYRVLRLPEGVCFELKWLSEDEFAHWSGGAFKETINGRKRREWMMFEVLNEGGELPEGVVKVQTDDDRHVVDYLKSIYPQLSREMHTPVESRPPGAGSSRDEEKTA